MTHENTQLYRHFDTSGALLYVGISVSALQRFSQHKNKSHWSHDIARIEVENFATKREALDAEKRAIAVLWGKLTKYDD